MIAALLQSAPAWAWFGFHVLIFLMLALDLGVFNRKAHAPSFKESAIWSIVWIGLALLFPVLLSLGIIALILAASMVASLARRPRKTETMIGDE